MALESWVLSHQLFIPSSRLLYPALENRRKSIPIKVLSRNTRYPFRFVSNYVGSSTFTNLQVSSVRGDSKLLDRTRLRCLGGSSDCLSDKNAVRELAEKESENGVFRLLRSDVTHHLSSLSSS